MNIELLSIQTLVCSIAYFFAGIVDSITGGGGLITLAVMLTVGIPVHNIIATNQCAAFVGTGVGAYKFLRSGKIHRSSALITLPFAVIGSYCGARLNLLVPDYFLKVFLLVAVPIIAVFVITNKSLGEVDRIDEQPGLSIAVWSAAIGLVAPEAGPRAGHRKYKICPGGRFDHIGHYLYRVGRGHLGNCTAFCGPLFSGLVSGSDACH